jgi:hypothetical protein
MARRAGRWTARITVRSTEHAISTWPTTAPSIGVRYQVDMFVVCAPFGLTDLFAMVVRPNRALIDQAIYEAKTARWATLWPRLSVLPWQPAMSSGW